MTTCLILAAGLSQRFGSPKALAEISHQCVLEHILETLYDFSDLEIILVVGAHQNVIRKKVLNHKNLKVVYNKNFAFGQTSSVQSGIKAISPQSNGFFLWPVDYPFIQKQTLHAIQQASFKTDAEILIPTFNQKRGHPPFFKHTLLNQILSLSHTQGMNSLFTQNNILIEHVVVADSGILATFNTIEELQEIKKKYFGFCK